MSTPKMPYTDVLIVGSGPMGSATALALAIQGIACQVVSKQQWLAHSPRAHIVNQRAMEVLRDLGVEEECLRAGTSWDKMGDMVFATSLAGEEIARLHTWGTGDERATDYRTASPCGLLDLIQPLMEPILVDAAAARGAAFTFSTEYLSHVQDGDGVTTTVRDRLRGETYEIRSRYLVGADGARSKVAEDLGLTIEGRMGRAGTMYTLFDADLTRFVGHRPSILHRLVNPIATTGDMALATLRAIKPWTQWIIGWGYDIEQGEPTISDDELIARLRVLIGDDDVPISIVQRSYWQVNEAYATTYSKGRVFCGGDAVHRHPPSSGLGSNTCLQDAFNLAWKLAFGVRGDAGPALLESYSAERMPVGRGIVERANQSRHDYAPLRSVLKDAGIDTSVETALAALRAPDAAGAELRTRLEAAVDLKSDEFNAQGIELDHRYASTAVLAAPAAPPETWTRSRIRHVQPTTRPGAKLPHAWLVDADGHRFSTLDAVGRGRFTVLTGLTGHAWADAAASLDVDWLRTVVVGAHGFADPYFEWSRAREVEEGGVLLVRPDAYVAWRHAPVDSSEEAGRLLRSALASVLDNPNLGGSDD